MQDMIKKVVEMDEKARELEARTQQEKISIKEEISEQKQKIYEDYIEKARIRARKNDDLEQKHAEEQLAESKERHAEAMTEMKKHFDLNCDKWVDEIVRRVTE